jgi:hypothetical protein
MTSSGAQHGESRSVGYVIMVAGIPADATCEVLGLAVESPDELVHRRIVVAPRRLGSAHKLGK